MRACICGFYGDFKARERVCVPVYGHLGVRKSVYLCEYVCVYSRQFKSEREREIVSVYGSIESSKSVYMCMYVYIHGNFKVRERV